MTDLLLGTMRLDEDYNWIDPGAIGREYNYPADQYDDESSGEGEEEEQSQAQSNSEEEEKSDSTDEKVG